MGLTKQYLRFVPSPPFGLIASAKGGVRFLRRNHAGGGSSRKSQPVVHVAAACAEDVVVWNVKTGEKATVCRGGSDGAQKAHEVSALAVHQDKIAVGYEDGVVKLFQDGECLVTFNGHKSGVTTLAFDADGHRLASGAKDTCVIVWDVVNECGLYRLRGHKAPITKVAFLQPPPVSGGVQNHYLVSSSRDTMVKFWDVRLQHCFKTLTGHLSEVWDFVLVKGDKYLITGSGDAELRVWRLAFKPAALEGAEDPKDDDELPLQGPSLKRLRIFDDEQPDGDDGKETEDPFDAGILQVERVGSILRAVQGKVGHLSVDASDSLVACHGSDNTVELFRICTDDEVRKKLARKAKKLGLAKKRKGGGGQVPAPDEEEGQQLPPPTIQEEFRRLKVLKASGKVRHVDLDLSGGEGKVSSVATVLLSTANNQIELHRIDVASKDAEPERVRGLDHAGHRSDVRTLSFASDNSAILSVSHESLRVWSRSTKTCIRTIPSGYGLCSSFAPGDRHLVVGTKQGTVQIFELGSATMTEEVRAHSKEVWSLHLTPDKRGFVTASGDKTVKFWQFELVSPPDVDPAVGEGRIIPFQHETTKDAKKLSVVHQRTLKLDEDALSVRLTPDGRLVAVSLLDSTVKVFFADSLKFFLSLYGHKLPAVAMDVSSDSTLLATGGGDKNIKIWGLDFGDCHKSMFAHDDTITAIQFVPNTHMFFSCAKDGKVKQWDADNFERILTLDGHHDEVWSLSVSPNGKYVATSGHDKTLRVWEKTQEILVLEDERETEREAEEDLLLATGDSRVVPGDQNKETGLASRKSAETEKGAERLMEAIELYKAYMEEVADVQREAKESGRKLPPPQLPVLMTVYPNVDTCDGFMAEVIGRVKSSELEETLLVLPLDVVVSLLGVLEALLQKDLRSEVACRMFFFLLEIHFGPLTASSSSATKQLVRRVRELVDARLRELRDVVGFNLAALGFVQNQYQEMEKVQAFVEATSKFKDKKRKRGQRQKTVQTALMSI